MARSTGLAAAYLRLVRLLSAPVNLAAFLACMAPPWVHMRSYWIPVSVLGGALALAVACLVIELRRRRFRWLVVYAAVLALQPAWELLWQELYGGGIRVRADCGYSQRSLSLFLLASTIALLIIVWRHSHVQRRSFIFGLAVAFTLFSALAELFFRSGIRAAIPHELYASIFSGFGGEPQHFLVFVSICGVLYVVRHFRRRHAV